MKDVQNYSSKRKQAKLRSLQDPSQINENNLINARCEASTHFREKKNKYLKDKINDLAISNENKTIRDSSQRMSKFKKDYNIELTW
jgi:hypothetical protein